MLILRIIGELPLPAKLPGHLSVEIVILVSESPTKGGGHVKRQMAVVEEAIERGHRITVIGVLSMTSSITLRKLGANVVRVVSEVEAFEHARQLLAPLMKIRSRVALIVDDYDLIQLEENLLEVCKMVVVFTDGQELKSPPQLIVDSASVTQDTEGSRRISGLKAVMIGRQFKILRDERIRNVSQMSRPKRILVNFGGADSDDFSLTLYTLIKEVHLLQNFEIVLGPLYKGGLKDLSGTVRLESNTKFVFNRAHKYLSLLGSSEAAIGASGLSAYERAFVGLPSLNFAVAGNQKGIARILASVGAAIEGKLPIRIECLKDFFDLLDNPDKYRDMLEAGLASVDGQGVNRLITRIEEEA